MKRIAILRGLALLFVLLVSACGTPEKDCRDGIAEVHRKMTAMVGSSDLAGAVPAVREQFNTAKDRRDAGDYAECLEALSRARAEINRSQRTNQ